MLKDCQQSLINADVLGQVNLDLVREKSGICQGILLTIFCGNPVCLFCNCSLIKQHIRLNTDSLDPDQITPRGASNTPIPHRPRIPRIATN